jgi:amidohydrolase
MVSRWQLGFFIYSPMNSILTRILFLMAIPFVTAGQIDQKIQHKIDQDISLTEPKLIEWRREFHQYPELSNLEFKTGAKIADLLRSWGIEVHYPVAKTGVLGVLYTGHPGPVVALRADMDGLPLTENNGLPYASKEKANYNGQEVGVMHACGHDAHMAILLGVAEILARHKSELKGTIKFIFQPAEEGAPKGEEAGAFLMIKEGVLENPSVDAIFGLHVMPDLPPGEIAYRSGPFMAAVDGVDILVQGKPAHGARPWEGIDPIVVSSQIVMGLQTIVSRQADLTKGAVVITIGDFHSGVRRNIIPEQAKLEGTIRTFDPEVQKEVHRRIQQTAVNIAEASGATATVSIETMYPATINNPVLTETMVPSLRRSAGAEHLKIIPAVMIAEDFSFFQQKVPGLYFFLGVNPGVLPRTPAQHTVDFMLDEKALPIGLRAMLNVTLDYLYLKK